MILLRLHGTAVRLMSLMSGMVTSGGSGFAFEILTARRRQRPAVMGHRRDGGGRDRVGQDSGGAELGGDPSGEVPVFALDVSANGVVPGEGARTVWTRHADALVSLTDVSPEIGLVAVGALAEGAAQLGAGPGDRLAVVRVPDGHGKPHVVATGQAGCQRTDPTLKHSSRE